MSCTLLYIDETRNDCSRTHTVMLVLTVPSSTATRCQPRWGGGSSEVNKIEQVSIDDHQMSLAGGSLGVPEVPCLVCVCGGGGGVGLVQ